MRIRHFNNGNIKLEWVSEQASAVFLRSPAELQSDWALLSFHPDDVNTFLSAIADCSKSQQVGPVRCRLIGASGVSRIIEFWLSKFATGSDSVLISSVALDVTAAHRARQGAEINRQHIESLLLTAMDGVITLNGQQIVTSFSSGAEKIFGIRADDIIGRPMDSLLPRGAAAHHAKLVSGVIAGPDGPRAMGNWRRIFGRKADGTEFPLLASVSKATTAEGVMMTAFVRDMSEPAQDERRLRDLLVEKERLLQLAEQGNMAKEMFLASMSHELRTPLNAIVGFSELISSEAFGPIGSVRYREYIGDILRSGNHLLRMINDILQYTKAQANGVELVLEEVYLTDIYDDAQSVVQKQAGAKSITLAARIPEYARVVADPVAIRHVLQRLMENAIKYSPEGGRVEVVGKIHEGDTVEFTICDSGSGVPAESLDRLGQPFFQIRDSYRSDNPGTGLGLAIIKQLVEAHEGQLRFSRSDLGGLCVSVEIPSTTRVRTTA